MSTCVSVCVYILGCTLYYYFMCVHLTSRSTKLEIKKKFSIFIRVYLLYNVVFVSTTQHSKPAVVVIQSPSHVQLFATPWTAARQASLSLTIFWFAQVHVYCIGDAIQPSHPLTPSSASRSFPASGTLPMSHLSTSDDQNTGASASASVLPVNIQG